MVVHEITKTKESIVVLLKLVEFWESSSDAYTLSYSLIVVIQGKKLLTLITSSILLGKLSGFQLVKKFHTFFWNPKVHYQVYKSQPPG